jgi:hypothetical protein
MNFDPHWEWIDVTAISDRDPVYVRGRCNHLETVPVESDGAVVAHLCLTCDCQLP